MTSLLLSFHLLIRLHALSYIVNTRGDRRGDRSGDRSSDRSGDQVAIACVAIGAAACATTRHATDVAFRSVPAAPMSLFRQQPSPEAACPPTSPSGPFRPLSPPPTVTYLPAGYTSSDLSTSTLSSGGLTDDTKLGDESPSWLADSLPDLAAVRTVTLGPPLHSSYELAGRGIRPPKFISRGIQADALDTAAAPPTMVDAGTEARRMPGPTLEPPTVASAVLAERAAQAFFVDFQASPHTVAERVLATVPTNPGQRRAVELAVRFGADVLRTSADLVLSALHANFGHILGVQAEDMLRFIVDHIDCWCRRPAFAEHSPVINLLDDIDSDD